MQTMMPAAQREEVRVRVVTTMLAVNEVMHVQVMSCTTPRHAALVSVTRQDAPALPRRDRVTRAGIGLFDVAHDRRVAREGR